MVTRLRAGKPRGLCSIPGRDRFFLLSKMFKWVMKSTTDLHPGLRLRKSEAVLLLSVSHGDEFFGIREWSIGFLSKNV
jgi:hypothetical protein